MPQSFPHRHLLDIERLTRSDIETILESAAAYALQNRSANRKSTKLNGKTIVNLFFENSTRTRTSFEIAAKRLSADVVNVPLAQSSTAKGETLLDTVLTLDAMQIDALVIRHKEDGIPQFIAPHVKAHVINAGDGKHEHPTQALLDALTIMRHKKKIEGLTIAICGDVAHSRVAKSNTHLLTKLGAKVHLISPPAFAEAKLSNANVTCFDNLDAGLKGVDAVMSLRIQLERISEDVPMQPPEDYFRHYGITHEKMKLAKPDALLLDPGPVMRNVGVSSELADDPHYSVIREQVEMGVAVRMAVLDLLLTGEKT